MEMSLPGGDVVPIAGLTWVGVHPDARRRGVLAAMMTDHLARTRDAGTAVSALHASEAAIYGRFGYGIAAPNLQMEADQARFALRDDPGPRGSVRIVPLEDALEPCRHVWDTVRPTVPGFTVREDEVWTTFRLADPEEWRRGASPKYCAVVELDGQPVAYALYRIRQSWEQGFSKSEVRLVETVATTPAAERELWRFVFGIDLIARVGGRLDPASPLFLMTVDPRSLHLRVSEGLWLRLVDVEQALAARSYAGDGEVVLDVRDEFCSWNTGRYRVGGTDGRTDADADLELAVADLASVYLGAFTFSQLAAAERVRELKPGALARADELFRTPRPPYCPEDF
jgi:predicted acetyltransferase